MNTIKSKIAVAVVVALSGIAVAQALPQPTYGQSGGLLIIPQSSPKAGTPGVSISGTNSASGVANGFNASASGGSGTSANGLATSSSATVGIAPVAGVTVGVAPTAATAYTSAASTSGGGLSVKSGIGSASADVAAQSIVTSVAQ